MMYFVLAKAALHMGLGAEWEGILTLMVPLECWAWRGMRPTLDRFRCPPWKRNMGHAHGQWTCTWNHMDMLTFKMQATHCNLIIIMGWQGWFFTSLDPFLIDIREACG